MEIRLRDCGCGTFHLTFSDLVAVNLDTTALQDLHEVLGEALKDLRLERKPDVAPTIRENVISVPFGNGKNG